MIFRASLLVLLALVSACNEQASKSNTAASMLSAQEQAATVLKMRADIEQQQNKRRIESEKCDVVLAAHTSQAKKLLKAGKPVEAMAVFDSCHDNLESESKKVYFDAKIAVDKQKAAQVRAEAKRLAIEKRKKGVSIGMTEEDVLASSWGKPDEINRTVNSYGVREQWVYRERSSGYLYFERSVGSRQGDGVLASIQN